VDIIVVNVSGAINAIPNMDRKARQKVCGNTRALAVVYFFVALAATFTMALLTPPLQVPDEHQHFYRAFQLSEGDWRGAKVGGALGAELPDSLGQLADDFLGSRRLHIPRQVREFPWRDTVSDLAKPLEPSKRAFLEFSAAVYSPIPYAPQIVGIAVARWLGGGALWALYGARFANALASVALAAIAIRLFPYRRPILATFAAMPMVLWLFGSASPDALLISGSMLLISVVTRAAAAGRWSISELALAAALSSAICSFKPVYAPLLLLGYPTLVKARGFKYATFVHGCLLAASAAATIIWFSALAPHIVSVREGVDPSAQLSAILAHPLSYARVLVNTISGYYGALTIEFIGTFGWLNVVMPIQVYLAAILLLISTCIVFRTDERASPIEATWSLVLLAITFVLVATPLYLYWTMVGSDHIEGIQGRYLLPTIGLLAVTASAGASSRSKSSTVSQIAIFAAAYCLVLFSQFWIALRYGLFA
jgi:uncharacterized membrane protein